MKIKNFLLFILLLCLFQPMLAQRKFQDLYFLRLIKEQGTDVQHIIKKAF